MSIEAMKQLIEDCISMMEYHIEQTRPIHTTTVAIQAAKEALKAIAKAEKQEPLCTAAMFDEWFLAKSGLDPKTPLYDHPQPKREWVGLTDEEIDGIVKNTRWHELIKATEAKLKEKNT